MHLINNNLQKLFALCRKYRVNKLYALGSILSNRFNDTSDIDFLVDFKPDITYHNYANSFFGLYNSLRVLLGREIDLVYESSLKNKYFKEELEETKYLIYA